jgi:hypothetical protein
MRGIILLDEGALHEAILEAERERRPRVWSAARFSEARGYRPTGKTTGLRGASLDEEARVTEKARLTQALPEARPPGSKPPQWSADRRRAPRQVRTYGLPKRLVGAPPPSFGGRERRTKGGPAPSSTGGRSVGLGFKILSFSCHARGRVDFLRPENCSRDGVEATIMLKNRASGFPPGVQTGGRIMAG